MTERTPKNGELCLLAPEGRSSPFGLCLLEAWGIQGGLLPSSNEAPLREYFRERTEPETDRKSVV